jgi:cell division protease FtsH
VLTRNREILERCARELLARETLDEEALRALTHDLKR